METAISALLKRIKQVVKAQDPEAKVYLFGSRTNGTARSDSDWDLLILLNTKDISLEHEQKITHPLYELEFDTGQLISPIIYSEEQWNTRYKITPFYKSVMRQAQLL